MPSVVMIDGSGHEQTISSVTEFTNAVYVYGWVPKNGTVEENAAVLRSVSGVLSANRSAALLTSDIDTDAEREQFLPSRLSPAALEAAYGGAGAVSDATTTTKGVVRLAGDLGGTATSPTVPGLAGKASTTDPRLSDARTPLTHSHAVGDLTATGTRDATTFLRGDNTWAAAGSATVDASTTVKGIVELATTAETTTGTDTVRAVTPAGVKAVADTKAALAHTHALADVTGAAAAAGVEGIKTHDGTAGGGTRPSGFARVRWVGGTTRPTNMAVGDVWERDA